MLNEKVSLSVSSVVKVCVALVCEEVDPNSYQGNSSVSNFFFSSSSSSFLTHGIRLEVNVEPHFP